MRPLLARDVQAYRLADDLTGALICLMIVFSPWAFGTTDVWAVRAMNFGGFGLGALLSVKLGIRWWKGYRPPQWTGGEGPRTGRLMAMLAGLTVAIPVYCLVGALNAHATYRRELLGFEYHEFISWLPSTLDSRSTWFVFWCSLGLAGSFWGMRDWLTGKSLAELRSQQLNSEETEGGGAPSLPARWRGLLWLLTVNGGMLAVEGIVQRLANCPRLLFLTLPAVHQTADTQFGPYAYRSNAAQYFNLLWPVSLGFWWWLRREGGSKGKAQWLPLVCAAIMAACPIISTTRGGALVAVGQLIPATVVLMVAQRGPGRGRRSGSGREGRQWVSWHEGWWRRNGTRVALGLFLAGSLALGFGLGWKTLAPRMAEFREGYEYRERMFQNAHPMAEDYPIYGIGPGAFVYVFQLYRVATSTYWPPELHHDWRETRFSFGWIGSGMIALALALVWARWFLPGGLPGCGPFTMMVWLAMGGCLVHARFDFPFQVYSVVFLFLTWCAMLVNVSWHRAGPK